MTLVLRCGAADWSPFHCRSTSRDSADVVGGVNSFDTAVRGTSVTAA